MTMRRRTAVSALFIALAGFVVGVVDDPPRAEAAANNWLPSQVDITRLPLGDSRVSVTNPARGVILSCTGPTGTEGAEADGEWIDAASGTWDRTRKLAVQGRVIWEQARYEETISPGRRMLATNKLPVHDPTGTFPVAPDDPAHRIDRNPNSIGSSVLAVALPLRPAPAEQAGCLGAGPIGIFRNGVVAYNSLDERGRDAVAHEVQDECNGHPEMTGTYHYHAVAQCLLDKATGPSTVVGFAFDGFPIVVERDRHGRLPSNADLDDCHGRTSPVLLDGRIVPIYHYSATWEFPYFIGCFHGRNPIRTPMGGGGGQHPGHPAAGG
jgi:YHYH protein